MAKVEYVAYGPLARMVAEVGTIDPVPGGLMTRRQAKYAVTIIGAEDWDSEYFPSRKAAKAEAKYLASLHGVKTLTI